MVCGNLTDVCGWGALMNGNIISAAFTMYDASFMGWTVAILFIVYQFMLFMKTFNLTLCFVTGLIFASLYAGAVTILKPISLQVIFILLVFQLGAILYLWFFK
jgi:hypothetical protein